MTSSESSPYKLFPLLLGSAIIFQLISSFQLSYSVYGNTFSGFLELILFCLSLQLIIKPEDKRSLVILSAIYIINLWIGLPFTPNHRLITAFICLAILLITLLPLPERETPVPHPKTSLSHILNKLAPIAKACTIIIYFFAAFHKLNTDFFNPEVSCSQTFYKHITDSLPFLPQTDFIKALLPITTVFLEFALPLFLLIPKLRSTTVFVALLFHFILALDNFKHFFDFSSCMYMLLYFFSPASFAKLEERSLFQNTVKIIFIALSSIVICSSFFAHSNELVFSIYFLGRECVWWIFSLNILFNFSFKFNLVVPKQPLRFTYIIPLLLLINGISPYLGLKNKSSFDMYSNLRLPESNHYIIKHPLDLLGYGSDPEKKPSDLNYFAKKLIWFRPLDKEGKVECTW